LGKSKGQIEETEISTDFAKRLSHDLRSPISAINLVAGSAKELPEAKRKLLEEAAVRLTMIADDLQKKSLFKEK
jgi:K+-sensing histidine kinase KdpD